MIYCRLYSSFLDWLKWYFLYEKILDNSALSLHFKEFGFSFSSMWLSSRRPNDLRELWSYFFQLLYEGSRTDHTELEVDEAVSPKKLQGHASSSQVPKRPHRSFAGNPDQAWSRRMEGFEGFQMSGPQNKRQSIMNKG